MQTNENDDGTQDRVAAILDEFGDMATRRGWAREDVAVAMAMGAADLALWNSATAAEVDRSLGALFNVMRHRALHDLPADPGHGAGGRGH